MLAFPALVCAQDPLVPFHDALRRGAARVTVYGASHTAGDQYTRVLRRALQSRFGEGGPGWVLPAVPFPFYEHGEVEIRASGFRGLKVRGRERRPDIYGLAGFAVEGEAGATSVLRSRARFSRVVVHYLRRDGARFSVTVGEHDVEVDASGEGVGRLPLSLEASGDEVRLRVLEGTVRFFGVELLRTAGVVVDAFGVPGARVFDQDPWNARALGGMVRARPPDLWALAYGTNEAAHRRMPIRRYRERLRAVMRRWKRMAPRASCLLIGPGEWPRRRRGEWIPRPRTVEIVEVQREEAARMGCAFFDTFAMMGGEGGMVRWVAEGLALDDHVHFTDAGYARMGRALHRFLRPRADADGAR